MKTVSVTSPYSDLPKSRNQQGHPLPGDVEQKLSQDSMTTSEKTYGPSGPSSNVSSTHALRSGAVLSPPNPSALVNRSSWKHMQIPDVSEAISGDSLRNLAKKSIGHGNLYVYASVASSDGHLFYIDGNKALWSVFEQEDYKDRSDFLVNTKHGSFMASKMKFYFLKSFGDRPQELPNIMDLKKRGYTETLLHLLVAGISRESDSRTRDDVHVFVAACFSAGDCVPLDLDYAKKRISGLSQDEIDMAVERVLTHVAFSGIPSLVKTLVSIGGKFNHLNMDDNNTPLMYAVHAKNIDVAKELVACGSDPYFIVDGRSAVDLAETEGMHSFFSQIASALRLER